MDIVDMLKEQFGEAAISLQRVLPDDIVVVTLDNELISFKKKLRLHFTGQLVQLSPFCQLRVIDNRIAKAVIIPAAFEAALSEDELTAILYHELGHLHDPALLAMLRGVADTRDEYEAEVYADNYAVQHGYGRYLISALVKAVEVTVKAMEKDRSLVDPAEARDKLTNIMVARTANLQQSIAAFEQHSVA